MSSLPVSWFRKDCQKAGSRCSDCLRVLWSPSELSGASEGNEGIGMKGVNAPPGVRRDIFPGSGGMDKQSEP